MPEEKKQDWSQALGYVSPGDLAYLGEAFKYLKERSYEFMQLDRAKRVLDVGCGIGIDTVAIAGLVGSDATVYGIDHDAEMIRLADERASSGDANCDIIHQHADVLDLPFPDGFFDASRAERVFQNLPETYDMNAVYDEMLRVTRKGGTVVLMDRDFGATSVDFKDAELANRLLTFYGQRLCPNGYAGRQHYGMLRARAMKNVATEVHPVVFPSLHDPSMESSAKGLWRQALRQIRR